jgi:hypothetical protein
MEYPVAVDVDVSVDSFPLEGQVDDKMTSLYNPSR